MRNPRLLIAAIALLLAGLLANHLLQRPAPPQFAPALQNGTAGPAGAAPTARASDRLPPFLPAEARATIALIQRGGPFPHRQDGSVFGNREQRLPQRPRGYYREYTVDTPGAATRGTRRIITGGDPPDAWYYTDDHYDSFRSFTVPAPGDTR
ncbi:ribonuclease domain-containing protein [Stenotrophomonas sp. 24(2023)]|uniref:ribonuclease domain-containing protein n=1 Tax=Stenotrophomonas sp. 24(2023) TaxID=3068324 RepID=UPI0027E11400|nr:ribonuclease domain-containing protein [Stenotrophomonas sp. 24(2023)]WMJ69791.1 ribonuclease domain-containing protein [Stenotrophomonas sp. 24(2023)]